MLPITPPGSSAASCLQAVGASLDAELDWLDDMAERHAKNYQVQAECLAQASLSPSAGLYVVHGGPTRQGRLSQGLLTWPFNSLLELRSLPRCCACWQVWHHRRWVAEKLGAVIAPRELRFSEHTLQQGDSKNYHLWSHRIWILRHLGGATWQQELEFCNRLLADDLWDNQLGTSACLCSPISFLPRPPLMRWSRCQ